MSLVHQCETVNESFSVFIANIFTFILIAFDRRPYLERLTKVLCILLKIV